MPLAKGSKDALVILLGLSLIVSIGAWSFFRLENSRRASEASEDSTKQATVDNFKTISISKLQDRVLGKYTGTETNIVDMRPTSLWADEHIIGSESLMINDAESPSFQPTDDEKSRDWVIVAESPSLAGQLVAILRQKNVPDDHILVLNGTYASWKEQTGLVIRRADPTSALDITKVTLVSPEEAKTKIGNGGQWFILDIRSRDLFAEGHVAGATNIPFADIESNREAIPSTANIFIYGTNDRESFAGGVLLFDLGFFNTITLSAGFDDWKAKNLPVGR